MAVSKLFVVIVIAGLMSMMLVSTVSANHLLTGHKWKKDLYFCISPQFSSTLNNAIRQSESDIQAIPGLFTIYFVNYDGYCINHIKYCSLDPAYLAFYTMVYNADGSIKQADICVTTDAHNTLDNSACQDFPPGSQNLYWHYNLRIILHHEFYHLLEAHHGATIENTVMSPTYNCARWGQFSQHDRDTLLTAYPYQTQSLKAQSLGQHEDKGFGGHSHEQKIPQIPFNFKHGAKHDKQLQLYQSTIPQQNSIQNDKKVQSSQEHNHSNKPLSDSQQKTHDRIMKQRDQLKQEQNQTRD